MHRAWREPPVPRSLHARGHALTHANNAEIAARGFDENDNAVAAETNSLAGVSSERGSET
jgi:hypothetical protein